MQPLPNQTSPFVDGKRGIIAPWNSYLQQFTQKPPVISLVTVKSSPFSYVAKEPGVIVFEDGTVSLVKFTRGSVVLTVVGSNFIPVGIEDVVTITYSVLPKVYFIANFGNVPP